MRTCRRDRAKCAVKCDALEQTAEYPIPCFPSTSSFSSLPLRLGRHRGLYFESIPPLSINRQPHEKTARFQASDSCQPRSFLFLGWLSFIQASPLLVLITDHLLPLQRGLRADLFMHRFRYLSSFIFRSYMFSSKHPLPRPFPGKNLKPDVPPTPRLHASSTQIIRNPCPRCFPQVIFGLPSYSQGACRPSPSSHPSVPTSIFLPPWVYRRRLTCCGTA